MTRKRLTDAVLVFTVQDASDPKNTDDFVFRLTGADAGELSFALAPSTPLVMVRVTADAQVATDWDPETTYGPEDHLQISNPEMTRLFKEDQADRQGGSHIDWDKVERADAARRHTVAMMLKASELHSGTDFLHAAFIFQHGDSADDYLLAHVLAMVAMRKGRTDADWIAAATLDRYLQRMGRPQVFGTQFRSDSSKSHSTQDPFDRDLISDALRAAMNVPSLATQKPPPSN